MLATNARSVAPKIECLVDYLQEMDCAVSLISETWLKDGPELERDVLDLEDGTGYSMIYKNRLPNHRGYSTGGVAIIYRKSKINLKKYKLPGNNFEVVCGIGSPTFHTQKMIVLSVYIPPQINAAESKRCLEFIEDSFLMLKGRFHDQYIVVGGDFNRRDIDSALADFPDIKIVDTPPTCLLYTSPSPRDRQKSRMPSSA